jgi:hypothetical protein
VTWAVDQVRPKKTRRVRHEARRGGGMVAACQPGGSAESNAQPEREGSDTGDERQQPNDRSCDQCRAHARNDGREWASGGIHITESPRNEVFRLREAYDHCRRRQCECEQSEHEYPLVNYCGLKPLGSRTALPRNRFRPRNRV